MATPDPRFKAPEGRESAFDRKIRIANRRSAAIELRRGGASWEQIAVICYYANRSAACKDVQRALEHLVQQPAREYVAEQLSRLDGMAAGLWDQARKGHLGSVDRMLKILERQARLLGLDKSPLAELDLTDGGKIQVTFTTPEPTTRHERPDLHIVDLPAEERGTPDTGTG